MRLKSSNILVPLFALFTSACATPAVRDLPVTAQEQSSLTPAAVIADLQAGNQRYVEGRPSDPNVQARLAASYAGQYPKAVILSCLDSRVPVEQIFDQGIGDVFVGRVAGNVENADQLGSMEFAAKLSGVKLVLVLGHESCGAVKGACDGAQLGNLTGLLQKIRPAVDAVRSVPAAERSSKNKAFVEQVVEENVRMTVADIRSGSPILAEMEAAGSIQIVGAIYSLRTGEVRWLQ
jgi:carbonic anhydrase